MYQQTKSNKRENNQIDFIQYNISNIYFREQMAETETDGAMFTKYHLLIFPFILNNFIIIHSEINPY